MTVKSYDYRRSLSAGEIAPILRARTEVDKIRTGGAQTMRNMQVARNGVAFNRAGTQFVAEVKDSSKATRIVSWVFDDDDRYALEFGEGYVRFFQDAARIAVSGVAAWSALTNYVAGNLAVSGGVNYYAKGKSLNKIPPDAAFWHPLTTTIFEVPSPYTAAEVFDLRFAQSFDVLWITHPSHPPYELTRFATTTWTLLPMAFGPSIPPPTGLAVSGATGTGFDIRYQVTAIKEDGGEESLPGHVSAATASVAINGGSTAGRIVLLYPGAHGLTTGDVVHIVAGSISHASSPPLASLVAALEGGTFTIEVKDADEVYLDSTDGLVNPGGYSCSVSNAFVELDNKLRPTESNPHLVSWTAVDGASEYAVYRAITKNGTSVPSIYSYIGKSKTPDFADDVAAAAADSTDTPPQYRNPFTATDAFPTAVCLFQQRLCFAGTNAEPAKFWLSRVGDLRNFSIRSPLQADDAVSGEVAISNVQDVRHMIDGEHLILFTGGRKCVVQGDSDGSIQPTSINVIAKGGRGGISNLPPLPIESDYLYVDGRESIVRNFRLDLVEGQKAADLTTYASHLFGGYTLSDWCYQQIPQTTVWAVRSDGKLLGLTHAPEQQIDAWHRHDTGSGVDFGWLSGCCIPENGEDMHYGIVGRTVTVAATNTVTLQAIGYGGFYFAGATGLLFAGARIFDGSEDGAVYTLTGGDGATATMVVHGPPVTDQQLTVTFLTAVPASLQNIATLLWTGPHAASASVQIKQYVERMHLRKMADAAYNVTRDAKFLDSMLTYDGRNTSGTTLTLTTAPWGAGSTHTLTASAGLFAGGAGDIGKKYRLHLYGEYVDVTISVAGSTTACTVIATQAVPTILQGVGTITWSRLALTVTGLAHLEGRTVGLLGDGAVLVPKVVMSAAVAVSTPSEIVHVGLPIVAQAKTMPLSAPESPVPLEALQNAARAITLLVKDSAGPSGLKAGPDEANLVPLEWAPSSQTAAQKAAVTAATLSGKMRAALKSDWDNDGVLIQQTDPLPLIIEGIVLTYEVTTEGRSG